MMIGAVAGYWEMFSWEFTTQFSIMEIHAWDLQRQPKRRPAPHGSSLSFLVLGKMMVTALAKWLLCGVSLRECCFNTLTVCIVVQR